MKCLDRREWMAGSLATLGMLSANPNRAAADHRQFAALPELRTAVYSGIEMACLDAIGRATGLRLCELLGGPVREEVEFASYLFFRYAADHPAVFGDPRLVDRRGRGDTALDPWGEVRSPESMAETAEPQNRRSAELAEIAEIAEQRSQRTQRGRREDRSEDAERTERQRESTSKRAAALSANSATSAVKQRVLRT